MACRFAAAGIQQAAIVRMPTRCSRPSVDTSFLRNLSPSQLCPRRNSSASQPGRRATARYVSDQMDSDSFTDDADVCVIPVVSVSNDPEHQYTELKIEVLDYPGLLRVVSWVLNGMGMRAHNASLKTTEEGIAEDTFWLTDYAGRKLTDSAAESLAERLQDYILKCKPAEEEKTVLDQEYQCGNVVVSNTAHPKYTEITIKGEPEKQGFLLDVASLITGIGFVISEAVIKGGGGGEQEDYDFKSGRLFRFWVTDADRNKLDYPRISALFYTLRLVMGKGSAPTTPPNLDILAQSNKERGL